MFPRENLNFILITVIQPSDIERDISEPACPEQQQCTADPPPGHAPQRSETPPAPDESWDDVSIDYGFVGMAPKINVTEDEKERERKHGGGGGNYKDEEQKCVSGDGYKRKEWRVDGCFAGVYAPQANHNQDKECPGLFRNSTPQFGLFHIPLNLQSKKEGGMGVEMDRKVRVRAGGKIDGGVGEEGESERVPLFSYASQNIKDMSIFHADQSDSLLNDYGVLRPATEDEIDEEEEEETSCIDWDPMTRKLVLPEFAMEFTNEGSLDELMHGEKGRENRVGGEKDKVNAMKDKLTLESVYVREASEEEAEAEAGMEKGGERQWEADDILTKWNLVISMEQ